MNTLRFTLVVALALGSASNAGALSVHSALLVSQPSPNVAIAPVALSRNDKDGVYGSPGGLFSEYSVGAQVMVNWEVAGPTGELLLIGGGPTK